MNNVMKQLKSDNHFVTLTGLVYNREDEYKIK